MVDKSAGSHEEAIEAAVAVDFLDSVEESGDYVVSAGSLSAREDYTYVDWCRAFSGVGVFLKLDFGETVGVREQSLDVVLIGY